MAYRILLLEDDTGLAEGLDWALRRKEYEVQTTGSVREAMDLLDRERYDLLLLDVSLPDGTGFEVCRRVRGRQDTVPIIFLTAADEEVNVIRGLEGGGDDYITKPFRLGELCSRIHALLRRARIAENVTENRLESDGLIIDLLTSRASMNGMSLELTAAEYRLLCLLVRNENRVVTREWILRELWDTGGNYVDDNTLSVYIRRLREKVEEDPSHPRHLITVRGFGYQWKV